MRRKNLGAVPALRFCLFMGIVLFACGSDVERVEWEDVSCFPYGGNFYNGTYRFQENELTLAVSTGNGECCGLIGATLAYQVMEITETTLVMALEGDNPETWTRQAGTADNLVGFWSCATGQTFDFHRDHTLTGSDDPLCL